jgi:hypothetical protein
MACSRQQSVAHTNARCQGQRCERKRTRHRPHNRTATRYAANARSTTSEVLLRCVPNRGHQPSARFDGLTCHQHLVQGQLRTVPPHPTPEGRRQLEAVRPLGSHRRRTKPQAPHTRGGHARGNTPRDAAAHAATHQEMLPQAPRTPAASRPVKWPLMRARGHDAPCELHERDALPAEQRMRVECRRTTRWSASQSLTAHQTSHPRLAASGNTPVRAHTLAYTAAC